MSLINQVLQDLDKRGSDAPAGAIPSEVRVVPRTRKSTSPMMWIAGIIVILVVAGGAWYAMRDSGPAPKAPAPMVAQQAPKPAVPAVAPAPEPAPIPAPVPAAPKAEEKPPVVAAVTPAPVEPPAPKQMAAEPTKEPAAPKQAPPPLAPTKDAAPPKPTPAAPVKEATPPPVAMPSAKAELAPQGVTKSTPPSAQPAKKASSLPELKPPQPAVVAEKAEPKKAEPKKAEPRKSEATSVAAAPVASIETTPQQRAENEYRKAVNLMQQGQAQEAITGFEGALRLDPKHGAARQTLASLLLEQKRIDAAASKLEEGLELDANQPGLALILARIQVEKGNLPGAEQTLRRTLPHATDRADYQAFLAAVLQREGLHQKAIEHYGVALQRMPQQGVWWMGMAISLQAENRNKEAFEAFTRAKGSNTLSPELVAFVDQKLNQLR